MKKFVKIHEAFQLWIQYIFFNFQQKPLVFFCFVVRSQEKKNKQMVSKETIEWSAIQNERDRMMIKDLYEAAEKANALHKLAGIKNLTEPVVGEINEHLQYEGHSGYSFAWTLRQVQYLVENGFSNFLGARGDPMLLTD